MASPSWLEDTKLVDVKIPASAVSKAAVLALCKGGVPALTRFFSSKGEQTHPAADEPKQPQPSNPADVRTIRIKRPGPASTLHSPPSVPHGQQGQASSSSSPEGSSEASQKQKDQEARAAENAVKDYLKRKGLDFNDHFQVEHKGSKRPSGHWKTFLKFLQGTATLNCTICHGLLEKFSIVLSECQEAVDTAPLRPRKMPKPSPEAADPNNLQLVPFDAADTTLTPPKKRQRAGRPKKGEQPDEQFDLAAYLETRRAGQYRFLGEEEALARLPLAKSREVGAGTIEMSKHPVQCLLCGVYFHLPFMTNNLALMLDQNGWICCGCCCPDCCVTFLDF